MELDTEKISDIVATLLSPHYKDISSIETIIQYIKDDVELTVEEKLFAMFAMGRRFENGRLYSGMQDLFRFGGKLTDPDPEEDEKV